MTLCKKLCLALAGAVVAGVCFSSKLPAQPLKQSTASLSVGDVTFLSSPLNNAVLEDICGPEALLREDYLAFCSARLQGERAAHLVEITASLLWVDYYLQDHPLYTTQKEE